MTTKLVVARKATKAGTLDRPTMQAEILDTNRVLISFPNASIGTKPSVVVDERILKVVTILLSLSLEDKDKIHYLARCTDVDFLEDVIDKLEAGNATTATSAVGVIQAAGLGTNERSEAFGLPKE